MSDPQSPNTPVYPTFTKLYENIRLQCSRHLFAFVAAAFGIWALLWLPQVRNLWQQLPPPTLPLLGLWLLNAAFLLVLGWFYVPAWFTVVGGSDPSESNAGHPVVWRRLCKPSIAAAAWLPWIVLHVSSPKTLLRLTIACLGVAVLILVGGSHAHGSRIYPLAGSFCTYSGLILALVGCWIAYAGITGRRDHGWFAVGRSLSWLIVGSFFGEILWICASFEVGEATYRIVSVWSLFHFFSVFVIGASLVDFCSNRTTWPVRQIALLGLVAALWFQRTQTVNDLPLKANTARAADAGPSLKDPATSNPNWYDYALARLEALPDGPVVIVAASGGGSRAAIFTAVVLEELSRTEMMAAAERSPNAPAPAENGKSHSNWSDHIFLISSVSGGSLATADFVVRGISERKEEIVNIDDRELLMLMKDHLNEVGEYARGPRRSDLVQRQIDAALQSLDDIDCKNSRFHWILSSRFVDDMATDFMAPILRGCFTPGTSRGDSLAHFWNERLEWNNASQADWDPNGAHHDAARYPLMVLNAADIDRGARLAIGFPRLPAGLLRNPEAPTGKSDTAAKLLRGEPATLADLDSEDAGSLTLARAVRLSSNFPWGFPVAKLSEDSSPRLNVPVRILDGGIIDNTGIDTLFYLFRGLSYLAKERDHQGAEKILGKLREKGVVLIEIDSGARPISPEGDGVFSGLQKPLEAMNNALYSNAEQSKAHFIDEIKRLSANLEAPESTSAPDGNDEMKEALAAGLQATLPSMVIHFRFRCNHIEDERGEVMTAWALGPRDEAIVLGQFLTNVPEWTVFSKTVVSELEIAKSAVGDAELTLTRFELQRRLNAFLESLRRIDVAIEELLKADASAQADTEKKRETLANLFQAQEAPLNELFTLATKVIGSPEAKQLFELKKHLDGRLDRLVDTKMLDATIARSLLAEGSPRMQFEALCSGVNADNMKFSRPIPRNNQSPQVFQRDIAERAAETKSFYQEF